MDKVKKGHINYENLKMIAAEKSIDMLETLDYDFIQYIGSGTYGHVIEIQDRIRDVKLAAKIVLQTTPGETEVWKSLNHPNVLPLLLWYKFKDLKTSFFVMPKYEMALDKKLRCTSLLTDQNGIEKLVKWLRDIVNGLEYLHEKEYCHLDLKLDNVLLSESDVACVADFGFACSASQPVNRSVI